jgi:hypothetical protein
LGFEIGDPFSYRTSSTALTGNGRRQIGFRLKYKRAAGHLGTVGIATQPNDVTFKRSETSLKLVFECVATAPDPCLCQIFAILIRQNAADWHVIIGDVRP